MSTGEGTVISISRGRPDAAGSFGQGTHRRCWASPFSCDRTRLESVEVIELELSVEDALRQRWSRCRAANVPVTVEWGAESNVSIGDSSGVTSTFARTRVTISAASRWWN